MIASTIALRSFRLKLVRSGLRGAIEIREVRLYVAPGHGRQAHMNAPRIEQRYGLRCGVVSHDGIRMTAHDDV